MTANLPHPNKVFKQKDSPITRQRKQLILNFIWEYRRIHEVSPTYIEIAKGISYSANAEGTAYTLCTALVAEGWLKKVGDGARMILPAKAEADIYAEITDPSLKLVAKKQKNLRILRRL